MVSLLEGIVGGISGLAAMFFYGAHQVLTGPAGALVLVLVVPEINGVVRNCIGPGCHSGLVCAVWLRGPQSLEYETGSDYRHISKAGVDEMKFSTNVAMIHQVRMVGLR